jgi:hypothetical protein
MGAGGPQPERPSGDGVAPDPAAPVAASGAGVDTPESSPDEPSPHEQRQTMLSEAIGGPRGLIDSGLPAIVFVVANAIGGLTPAIVAAVAVGVVLVAVRLYRKETLQQAIAGFFGVALAAVVAARTGHASGFFLPGILYQVVLAVASVVSLVIGRPYVGYVLGAFDPKYAHWRSSRPLRRAMALATVLWGLIFAARAVVQGILYLNDSVGWLATAKIAMGWPLFALGGAFTYWVARRAHPDGATGEPGSAASS